MVFDPLVEERVAPGVFVGRAQNGNPLIVPRGELEQVEYDRASSMADYLVRDVIGIKKWEMRLLARALGQRPDLAGLAAVETYNTGLGLVTAQNTPAENKASGARLDEVIHRAFDSIGMWEKADVGTMVHAATEPGFNGVLMPEFAHLAEAIHELTAGLTVVGTEVFVANDELRAAGTLDHFYVIEDQALASQLSEALGHDLTGLLIGDKKTGKVHIPEFEIQVGGVYAHGEIYLGPPKMSYDAADQYVEDQRLTFEEAYGMPVNRTTGLLVHAASTGSPKPRVLPLDLQRGRELALAAVVVRDARRRMDGIGIPKKIDMTVISKAAMEEAFRRLCEVDIVSAGAEGFREKGLALYGRFKAIWPNDYTDEIKRRLT